MGTGTPSMEEERGTGGKAGHRRRVRDRDENRGCDQKTQDRRGRDRNRGRSRMETRLGPHRVLSGPGCGTGLGGRAEGGTSKHRAELGKG